MTDNRGEYDSGSGIYVLLTDTGTLFTTLIKSFTAAPYNHASLALDAELNQVFSFGRKCPSKPWAGGFVKEDVYEGTFRHYPGTRCVLLRLGISKEQRDAAIRIVRSFQKDRHAYRYNLIGLLGVLLNLDMETKNAYFCSQFVSEALRKSGLSLWDRPSALVTPNDFLHHPAFDTVYEGLLYDYPLLNRDRLRYIPNGEEASGELEEQAV
ncbi:hypothetical protein J2Z22_001231 [Paenibacillus forsythiae]|uniref:Permuted papain-like amidase YaeF/Yiix C92 family enzyme n=1 Tax=Paenibacillus forsythiae TaxID=365616 RepID=A0ABU3H4F7_9BACL|nr:hypothetical protein [Paenibacillus forsythiae]MDT3425712.1 hypothetical protein [Paenibacillus forsythiae]